MFKNAVSLKEVKLPSNLTKLGASCFAGATALTSVDFGQAPVNTFGAGAFADTTNLTSIKIPATLKEINAGNDQLKGVFEGSGLTSIDLSGTKIVTGGDNSD